MEQYVGLDVSLKETSLCVVDQTGTTLWQGKCASTPECIAAVLARRAPGATRIGFESGLLSTWHWHALKALGLPVVSWMRAMSRQPCRCGSTRRMQSELRLWEKLPRRHRKRRRWLGRKSRPVKIPNRVSIRERPEDVNSRRDFGHWEGDTVVGDQHKTGVHKEVEQVSRLLFAHPVPVERCRPRIKARSSRGMPGSIRPFTMRRAMRRDASLPWAGLRGATRPAPQAIRVRRSTPPGASADPPTRNRPDQGQTKRPA